MHYESIPLFAAFWATFCWYFERGRKSEDWLREVHKGMKQILLLAAESCEDSTLGELAIRLFRPSKTCSRATLSSHVRFSVGLPSSSSAGRSYSCRSGHLKGMPRVQGVCVLD